MKKTVSIIIFILLFGAFLTQAIGADSSPAYVFSSQELDNLLAPVALYPDPLLAVMLPASTYPEEIDNADAWLKSGGTVSDINGQSWDESVKAIAYYPDILDMMAGDLDWTADLGDAFLNQPEDVTRSIQRLRWQARDICNLESNDNQQVIIDGENIEIIPAQPEYVYVPQYDDSVVYDEEWAQGSPPFITYGFGLAIGGWLSMDFDWRNHHIIYHGWNRPGWVNHARPYIHVTNVNVNRSRPSVNQTWRHDMSHGDPEKFRASQPGRAGTGWFARMSEARGRDATSTKRTGVVFGPKGDTSSFSNRGKQSLNTINQRQEPQAARISQKPFMPTGQASGIGRRSSQSSPDAESVQSPKTPSVTFGGYRGDSESKAQSLRGQSSRQGSMETQPSSQPRPAGKNIQSPRAPSASVSRGNAPENKESASGGKNSSRERHGR
jgi:hypothetical protein